MDFVGLPSLLKEVRAAASSQRTFIDWASRLHHLLISKRTTKVTFNLLSTTFCWKLIFWFRYLPFIQMGGKGFWDFNFSRLGCFHEAWERTPTSWNSAMSLPPFQRTIPSIGAANVHCFFKPTTTMIFFSLFLLVRFVKELAFLRKRGQMYCNQSLPETKSIYFFSFFFWFSNRTSSTNWFTAVSSVPS